MGKGQSLKYSFMTFSTPQLTFAEVVAVAKRFGYDGVEIRIDSKQKHGVECSSDAAVRKAARGAAKAAGVAICCVANSCTFADAAKAEEMERIANESIDLAADLGAGRVRVFGGEIPEGVSREQATENVARSLGRLAEHAQSRGVIVCMETHDHWCTPAHVAAVMRRVNHPGIGVNWDIMHPVRAGGSTMEAAFAELRPWVRHVHFHDGKLGDGMVTVGTGDIDHAAAVRLLLGAGYDGFLSGEWINWEPWEVHLPRELAAMKRFEQNARNAH